jgi:hypothetical protein
MGLFGGCAKSPSPNLVASFFGSLGLHPEWRDVDPLGYIFDGAIRCREKHQFGAYMQKGGIPPDRGCDGASLVSRYFGARKFCFVNNISCLYPTYIRGEAHLAAGPGTATAAEFERILDQQRHCAELLDGSIGVPRGLGPLRSRLVVSFNEEYVQRIARYNFPLHISRFTARGRA